MPFATLDDLDPHGKTVLVRADLNVPMKDGVVTEAARIEQAAKTIRELSAKGAKVIVLSHFGRPEGQRNEAMSLRPLIPALEAAIGGTVHFANDCMGAEAEAAVSGLPFGGVLLLENTRFHKGEEKNDPAMAAAMAKLGSHYVNDAFSCAHRAHASTEGLARQLPAYAGRGMQQELEALTRVLETPQRPVLAVIGGAKVSTKLELLKNLLTKVDVIVIGGGMANTFLAAQGIAVGKSLHEPAWLDTARDILREAKARDVSILLPEDVVVAKEFKPFADARTIPATMVPDDAMILDVGTSAIASIAARLETAKTVVWNGPLGAFETPPFDTGTSIVARHVGMLTKVGTMISVAGGGDTQAALAQAGAEQDFTYISTAGGAFLEWLEGKELPGVAALRRTT
ncbi:MAG TPA: phosphoglycerate kinase [Alphaproteobacteria bacterium]|nr:phosphoglycerate kinase [Alphaproteobacteria bacterium]